MIPLDEQMRMVEAYADDALDALEELLRSQRVEIRRRLVERVSTEGVEVYGDRTWHLPAPRCVVEAIDELADGGFYLVPPIARRAGDDALRASVSRPG